MQLMKWHAKAVSTMICAAREQEGARGSKQNEHEYWRETMECGWGVLVVTVVKEATKVEGEGRVRGQN